MKNRTVFIIFLIIFSLAPFVFYTFKDGLDLIVDLRKYYCQNIKNCQFVCDYAFSGRQCYCIKRYKNSNKPCLNSGQCGEGKCLANSDQTDYAEKNASLKLIKGRVDTCNTKSSILLPDNLNSKGACQSFPIEDWSWEWELNNGRLDFVAGPCVYF